MLGYASVVSTFPRFHAENSVRCDFEMSERGDFEAKNRFFLQKFRKMFLSKTLIINIL